VKSLKDFSRFWFKADLTKSLTVCWLVSSNMLVPDVKRIQFDLRA